MARHDALVLSILLLTFCIGSAWPHPALHVRTAKDLEHALFHEVRADACVRLLHRNGTVGCASPGSVPLQGPLLDLRNSSLDSMQLHDSTHGSVAVTDAAGVEAFLSRCVTDPAWARHWTAALVVPSDGASPSRNPLPRGGSMALDPGVDERAWNPAGTGLTAVALPFPLFYVAADDVPAVARACEGNAARASKNAPLHAARLAVPMQAVPASNSVECLRERRCLPLGGHTVYALIPGGNSAEDDKFFDAGGPGDAAVAAGSETAGNAATTASADTTKKPAASANTLAPVVLAARQDGASLFHGAAPGADGPASGLVAVLAAFRGLGRWRAARDALPGSSRPIAVLGLAGESWGALGSRRLLFEASSAGGAAPPHLAPWASPPAALLEVDSVGRPGNGTLFLHGGDAEVRHALLASRCEGLRFANASTQGLPPFAAARSFERVFGRQGVLVSGYDVALAPDTGTPHDAVALVDTKAVARAATALATAAAHLAGWVDAAGAPPASEAQLPDQQELAGYVTELLPCIQDLGCELGQRLLGPVEAGAAGGWQAGYPGILRTLTKEPQAQDPSAKSARTRFLFGYAAYAATGQAPPSEANASTPNTIVAPESLACTADSELRCPGGGVCVGPLNRASKGSRRQSGVGECLNVTAGFVPAYPTALTCDGCDGSRAQGTGWAFTDAAKAWEAQYGWPEEDVWTESNWPVGTPWVKLLLVESEERERATLLAGVLVAAASLAATLAVQRAWHKRYVPLPTEPS